MKGGSWASSQVFDPDVQFLDKTITSSFYRIDQSYPNSFTTIILRLMSITIFKSVFLGNVFKKFIVRKMMTGKRKVQGQVNRSYSFEEDRIMIYDDFVGITRNSETILTKNSSAIHMASSGYNPIESLALKSKIVNYINA